MAIHIHTTPSGVNEPALPRAGLLRLRGVPCRILSHGEMLALLDAEGEGSPSPSPVSRYLDELPPTPLPGADTRRATAYRASARPMFFAPTPAGFAPAALSRSPEAELGMTVGCFASTTSAAFFASLQGSPRPFT